MPSVQVSLVFLDLPHNRPLRLLFPPCEISSGFLLARSIFFIETLFRSLRESSQCSPKAVSSVRFKMHPEKLKWYKRNRFHFHHSCHTFPTTLRQPMSVAKKLAPNPSTVDAKRLLGNSDKEVTRLIVVRHPFNRYLFYQSGGIWFPAFVLRLVSAFRDKLERCHSVRKGRCYLKTDYYYNRLLLFLLQQ